MTTGGCVCGDVKYAYSGEPALKALCHCKECQRLTGSAFTYNFCVPRENFKVTKGALERKSFIQEIGLEVGYSFCGGCGTKIIKDAAADAFAPFYLVQAGTIDGADLVKTKPDVELWTSRRAEWIPEINGVAQKPQF